MDKRWIYILIILIIGVAALVAIVDSSTSVGSAVVSVHTYTTTLPKGYNIEISETDYASVINRQTDEKVTIKYCGKGNLIDENFEKKLTDLQNNENVTKINKTKDKYNNITFKTVNYEKMPNNTVNKILVFMKYGHTFTIESKNYHDLDTLNEKTNYVLDTLKPDYKKSQD